jgi:hypothetical protein
MIRPRVKERGIRREPRLRRFLNPTRVEPVQLNFLLAQVGYRAWVLPGKILSETKHLSLVE